MIAATVARLKGAPWRQVGGALDLPDTEEQLKASPAAFVVEADERAGMNELTGGSVAQQVRPTIHVNLAVPRKGAPGSAAIDPLKAHKKAVMDKLLGWPPGAGYAPYEYGGGRLAMVGKSNIFYQMAFVTDYLLRKV